MLEKRLVAVPPQLFTANGGVDGSIIVEDTSLFKVKQEVVIAADTVSNLDQIEIKRIVSPTTMHVGPKGGNIDSRVDLSFYTTTLNAKIFANEQKRPSIPFEEFTRAVYEEEPTVSFRSVLVDKHGNKIDDNHPLPSKLIDSSVNSTPVEFATRVDEASSTVIYIGQAIPGSQDSAAMWLIKKIIISGATVSTLYANGSSAYDQVWNNRAALTYV